MGETKQTLPRLSGTFNKNFKRKAAVKLKNSALYTHSCMLLVGAFGAGSLGGFEVVVFVFGFFRLRRSFALDADAPKRSMRGLRL